MLVRTAQGALPVMVTASVVPAEGCSDRRTVENPSAPDAGRDPRQGSQRSGAAGTAVAGIGGGIAGSAGSVAGSGGSAGSMLVNTGGSMAMPAGSAALPPDAGGPPPGTLAGRCSYTVALPEPGVPAEPGQICAATMVPVDSNRAARVALESVNGNPGSVLGTVAIAPSLIGMVVGTPLIEVIDATDRALLAFEVSEITTTPSGFNFKGRWSNAVVFRNEAMTRVTVRVSFEAACPDAPQVVHSVTDVHLCDQAELPVKWVSSGSVCSVCRIIAEMAPSPIMPDAPCDELPLSRALRLRIVELARVSGSVVLLAENDGGPDVEYEWSSSVGTIEHLAPDVIALSATPDMTSPFVQVAAFASDAAAVASWSFNDEVS